MVVRFGAILALKDKSIISSYPILFARLLSYFIAVLHKRRIINPSERT